MFNLAYTEGFESGGGVFYRLWFERMDKYKTGARPEAVKLYDWHFAEEFEHREVAYRLYMALAARGSIWRKIWYGYFYRIYGVIRMSLHGGKVSNAIFAHLLEVERREMTPAEVKASRRRERAFQRDTSMRTLLGLLVVLSPFYNPARKPAPAGLDEVLAQFAPGGAYAKPARPRPAAAPAV
ncbi:metal-dependent hydrolase [Phenylobacterium sp. LjRoot219]